MPQEVSLADSIRNIPPITRFFTICSVAICLLDSLGLVSVDQFISLFEFWNLKYKVLKFIVRRRTSTWLQIAQKVLQTLSHTYRFFTSFLVPAGQLTEDPMSSIIHMYFFYSFARTVETGKFKGCFPDCLWFTLLSGTIITIISLVWGALNPSFFPLHHEMMLSCVTYIWSRSLKNSVIKFMGLIPLKAYYLPLFSLAVHLIIHGYNSGVCQFMGIMGAYLYQCIQSNTLPIYNLFPQFYSQYYSEEYNARHRVGVQSANILTYGEAIGDSIFDKGYLPAPLWLYKFLSYPASNNRGRETAFTNINKARLASQKQSAPATGSTTSFNAFRGRGHRLGS